MDCGRVEHVNDKGKALASDHAYRKMNCSDPIPSEQSSVSLYQFAAHHPPGHSARPNVFWGSFRVVFCGFGLAFAKDGLELRELTKDLSLRWQGSELRTKTRVYVAP